MTYFSILKIDDIGQPESGEGRKGWEGAQHRESNLAELWSHLYFCDHRSEVGQEQTQLQVDPMKHSASV